MRPSDRERIEQLVRMVADLNAKVDLLVGRVVPQATRVGPSSMDEYVEALTRPGDDLPRRGEGGWRCES